MRKLNIVNQKFGRLTVLGPAGKDKNQRTLWHVKCDCGTTTTKAGTQMRLGLTKSCGCLNKERMHEHPASLRHGCARNSQNTPEYISWLSLRPKCENPKTTGYQNYGGRGITVCERWKGPQGFQNFLADVGPRPEPKKSYSIDRINNDGNYEPSNCKWSTRSEQQRNRRRGKLLVRYTDEEILTEAKKRGLL